MVWCCGCDSGVVWCGGEAWCDCGVVWCDGDHGGVVEW